METLYILLMAVLYVTGLAVLTWIRSKYGSKVAILAGIACILIGASMMLGVLWDWTSGFGRYGP